MSPSRRPGLRRLRPARPSGSSRYPVASAPVRHDALDWARAVLAGIEGVLLSWVAVLVPALIAYVVTAAAPSLGDASWQTAVRTATAVWLVGAGGTIETTAVPLAGGDEVAAVVSLVPLGLSLLTVGTLAWAARRQAIRDLPAAAVTTAAVVVTHLALSFLSPSSGGRLRLILGALVISALGLALSHPGALLRRRWPALARDALALAGRALAPLAGFGLALVGVAAVLGRDEVARLHGALAHDAVSTVMLVAAQLAFLPDLVVWALAFAAGPGFAVGEGTSFTFTEVVSAPLPAVPFLGGLPHPGEHALWWLAAVPVLIGAAAGAWAARRRPRRRRRDTLALAGVAALVVAAVALVAGAAASGSIGPGRMTHVGVNPWLTALFLGLEVGAGAAVALLALHPATRATLRGWISRGSAPAGGQPGAAGAPGEAGDDGARDANGAADAREGDPEDDGASEADRRGDEEAADDPDRPGDAGGPGPRDPRQESGRSRDAAHVGAPDDEEGVLAASPDDTDASGPWADADDEAGPYDAGREDDVDREIDPDDEPAVMVGYEADAHEVRLDPYAEWAQHRHGAPRDGDEAGPDGEDDGAGASRGDVATRVDLDRRPTRTMGVAERAAARAPQPDDDAQPDDGPRRAGEAPGSAHAGERAGDAGPDPAEALPGERIEPAPRTGLAARLARFRRR